MKNHCRVKQKKLVSISDTPKRYSKNLFDTPAQKDRNTSNITTSGSHETIKAHHYLKWQESGIPVKYQKIAVTSSVSGGAA